MLRVVLKSPVLLIKGLFQCVDAQWIWLTRYVINICGCNLNVRNVTVKNVMLVKIIKIQFKMVGNHEI